MIAFDTDVLSEILLGKESFAERAAAISPESQAVPIVVVEEMLRGRLNMIRRAETGKAKISVDKAYDLFQQSVNDFQNVQILSFTAEANALSLQWRKQKIRISTQDLRIAAVCHVHSARLISRNRKDYDKVPGLDVEYWS